MVRGWRKSLHKYDTGGKKDEVEQGRKGGGMEKEAEEGAEEGGGRSGKGREEEKATAERKGLIVTPDFLRAGEGLGEGVVEEKYEDNDVGDGWVDEDDDSDDDDDLL